MHNSEAAALFALLAAVSWGFSDFFVAKASKTIGPVLSMLLIALLEWPVFIVFYLISGHHWEFNLIAITYAICAGIFFSLAGTFFTKGLVKGPVSLVSPIAGMYPLTTTIIVIAVFKAHLSLIDCIGIVMIVVGVTAASGLLSIDRDKRKITPGIKLAILTSCMWGLAFALLAQAINRFGWKNASLIEISSVAVFMSIIAKFFKKREVISIQRIKEGACNKFLLLNTFIGLLGFVAISVALSKSTANGGAVATAISSSYPVITILLALKHFKEKVKPLALSGAFVGIAGVVLLSFS